MMDKYVEAEMRLAKALGWTRLQVDEHGRLLGERWHSGLRFVPCWSRDDADAFGLMLEYDISLGEIGTLDTAGHPTKRAAVRYAIVMAVIARLENGKREAA